MWGNLRLAPPRSTVVDVGGGASTLVDGLLDRGFGRITVLDLSRTALQAARDRLGGRADQVEWLTADVLTHPFATASVDVWHDRAVFHFFTDPADRRRYVAQVIRAVRPGGLVVIATFAEDGPTKCSGLDVCRWSPLALHAEFGGAFDLRGHLREDHVTPWGAVQRFQYCICIARSAATLAA